MSTDVGEANVIGALVQLERNGVANDGKVLVVFWL